MPTNTTALPSLDELMKLLATGGTVPATGTATAPSAIGMSPPPPGGTGTATGGAGDWQTQFNQLMGTLGGGMQDALGAMEGNPVKAAQDAAAAQRAYQASMIPGYEGLMGKNVQNIAQQQAGYVPQDVKNQMAQAAAERGVATGTAYGPGTNAAYLAALGRTSLEQQETGQKALGDLMSQYKTDPAAFIVTPAQRAQFTVTLLANAMDMATKVQQGALDRAGKLQIAQLEEAAAMAREQAEIAFRRGEGEKGRENALQLRQMADAAELVRQQADIASRLQIATLDRDTRLELQRLQNENNQKLELLRRAVLNLNTGKLQIPEVSAPAEIVPTTPGYSAHWAPGGYSSIR